MSEFLPQPTPEFTNDDEIFLRLRQLFDRYLSEDILFTEVEGMDTEDAINFAYGQLLENGEDPDEVLREFGLLDEDGDEVDDEPDQNPTDSTKEMKYEI